jgi:hypothetical protein
MPYRIERASLRSFVERQIVLIESTPMPPDLVRLLRDEDDLDTDAARAVWLGAGLATQIGLVLLNEPERFVVPTAPSGLSGAAP